MKHLIYAVLVMTISAQVFASDIERLYVPEDRSFRYTFHPDYIDSKGYPDRNLLRTTFDAYFTELREANKSEDKKRIGEAKVFATREGYFDFAEKFFKNNLNDCHRLVQIALGKTLFNMMDWGKPLNGVPSDYRVEYWRLTHSQGQPNRVRNKSGYIHYANFYADGDMRKAYFKAKSVLTAKEFNTLNWGSIFEGSVKEIREHRATLINESGRVNHFYLGKDGLDKYIQEKFDGKRTQAIEFLRSILDPNEIKEFKWGISTKRKKVRSAKKKSVNRQIRATKQQKIIDVNRSIKKGRR